MGEMIMSKNASQDYRWIMYIDNPGGLGGDVIRIRTLDGAKLALRDHAKDSGFGQELTVYGTYGPTASLYPYTNEDWAEAERMRDVGNPFDYPSKLVESGPRGGVRVTNA